MKSLLGIGKNGKIKNHLVFAILKSCFMVTDHKDGLRIKDNKIFRNQATFNVNSFLLNSTTQQRHLQEGRHHPEQQIQF